MITLTITDEALQASFEHALNKMLEPGNYDNPVKKALFNMLGYQGDKDIKDQIAAYVKATISKTMETPMFQMALGIAMANEIAKREVDKLKR